MVQHRAVRYILNDYAFTSSVTAMLKKLKLPTLENRRKISSLIMFFKIKTGQVRIPLPSYITPSLRNRYTITYSRVNTHLHSFFPRTARLWNNLPPDLTYTGSMVRLVGELSDLHCLHEIDSVQLIFGLVSRIGSFFDVSDGQLRCKINRTSPNFTAFKLNTVDLSNKHPQNTNSTENF